LSGLHNGLTSEHISPPFEIQLMCSRTAGPDDDDPIFAATSALFNDSSARADMQTFVFSATLSKDLQQNLKKRYRAESKPSKKGGRKATALGELYEHLE